MALELDHFVSQRCHYATHRVHGRFALPQSYQVATREYAIGQQAQVLLVQDGAALEAAGTAALANHPVVSHGFARTFIGLRG